MRNVEWLSGAPSPGLGQVPLVQLYVQRGDRLEQIGRPTAMSEAQARVNIEQAVAQGSSVPMGYSAEVGRVVSWHFYDGHRWTEGRPGQQQRPRAEVSTPKIQLYSNQNGQWVPYGPTKQMSEMAARQSIEKSGTAPLMYSVEIDMSSYGMPEPVVGWRFYNGTSWFSYQGGNWVRESAVSWLGGSPPVGVGAIPWQCWDMPGFKDCHAEQWRRARTKCEGSDDFHGYGTMGTCINAFTNDYAESECVPQFCARGTRTDPNVEDPVDFPWLKQSPHTCTLQAQINLDLRLADYEEISEDCVLGPATCGAARAMGLVAPTTCQGFTDPVKKGAAPPPQPGTSCPPGQQLDPVTGQCISPPTPTAGKRKKKDNTGVLLLGVAALAAGAFALI